MKSFKITNENLIGAAIFLAALGIRLTNLGQLSLSDPEAVLALQALNLSSSGNGSLLFQPGYISLTSFLFFLFGSGDFLARLIPAMSGSLMAAAPLLFRRQLGSRASLLLALFMAFDPGLLAFSRTADGTTLVLAFSILATGFLINGYFVPGGICAGLALLGGPLIWPGLISGGLAVWISRSAFSGANQTENRQEDKKEKTSSFDRLFPSGWRYFWLSLALTVAIIATQFFLHPRGINAVANSLVEYVKSWGGAVETPTIQSLLLFFVYEPFFLLLAIYGGIRAWFTGNEIDKFLIRWMVLAVTLSIFNPGQSFSSAAWVLVPMLALAARVVDGILASKSNPTPQAGAQALITFAMVIFCVLTVFHLSNGLNTPEDERLRLIAAAGSIIILLLTTYLLGSGWGWKTTAWGLKTSAMGLMALSVLSAGWQAAGLGRLPEREMWRSSPTVLSDDLLKTTIGDISEYNTGRRETLDVTIAGVDLPSLDWALRDFVKVSKVSGITSDERSSIIITPADMLPPLGENYRGQKIEWSSQPAWSLMNPGEWPAWLFFRRAPLDTASLIIWVRSDLFPGSPPAALSME